MVAAFGGLVNVTMAILTIIGVVPGFVFAWTFLAIVTIVILAES